MPIIDTDGKQEIHAKIEKPLSSLAAELVKLGVFNGNIQKITEYILTNIRHILTNWNDSDEQG